MNTGNVSYEQLRWSCACLALALIPHLPSLPLWIPLTVAASGAIRLVLAARGRGPPPQVLRLGIAAAAVVLLFLQYRTFNGISAGTALLALMGGLKLLETKTNRDVYVLILMVYFLSLSALLVGDSFWLFGYLVGVCWLTTATLLRLTVSGRGPDWRASLIYSARVLLHAMPLALVLWLFFPRFSSPLWQIPDNGRRASSGLSDTLSPGDITDLALSDEIAFRVRFTGSVPPPSERYWRGPVLHDFDGHTWRRDIQGFATPPALPPEGASYNYTVSIEPNRHNWVFVLDWPAQWDLPHGALTGDYMLVQPTPLLRLTDVAVTSRTRLAAAGALGAMTRQRDTGLPGGPNPRARDLALRLRGANPADGDFVRAVLGLFHNEPFYYTLTPPALADNSVDGFLFDSRRGYCGHYASAFAVLMRAAGIPARVVTGYVGGTLNRFADYWIVRQSSAHAWDEIWIDGRGWLRVDPTAAIAPERVERGLHQDPGADDYASIDLPGTSNWFADLRLRLDAFQQFWREHILQFDQASQLSLLSWLKIPVPNESKLALVLAANLALALVWLTWQVRREILPRTHDAVVGAYERLCARLATVALPRMPHEGAEAYAARVAARRPDLAAVVTSLCRRYTALRYGACCSRADAVQFAAAVRAFRPRDFRGS
jgi:transglutaminase-like putative cysteine protease